MMDFQNYDWGYDCTLIDLTDLFNKPYAELVGLHLLFEYKGKRYVGVIGINPRMVSLGCEICTQHPNEKLVIYVLSNQDDLESRIIEVETLELKDVYLIKLELKENGWNEYKKYKKKYDDADGIDNGMPFGVMC